MSHRIVTIALSGALALAAGCSSDTTSPGNPLDIETDSGAPASEPPNNRDPDTNETSDSPDASADAGRSTATDSGSPIPDPATDAATPADSGSPSEPEPAADAGSTPGSTATVFGHVSRSTMIRDGLDGHGGLYIALLSANPITDRDHAMRVAGAVIEDADLSAEGATVAYRIEGVPVSADRLFVSAFFDDNGNVDLASPSPGPDRGDLLNISLSNPLTVTTDGAGDFEVDIDLNAPLPF